MGFAPGGIVAFWHIVMKTELGGPALRIYAPLADIPKIIASRAYNSLKVGRPANMGRPASVS